MWLINITIALRRKSMDINQITQSMTPAELVELIKQATAIVKAQRAEVQAKREALQTSLQLTVNEFQSDFMQWLEESDWLEKAEKMATETGYDVDIKACYSDKATDFSLISFKQRKATDKITRTGTKSAELIEVVGDGIIPKDIKIKYLKPYAGATFREAQVEIKKLSKTSKAEKSVYKNAMYQLKKLMDKAA